MFDGNPNSCASTPAMLAESAANSSPAELLPPASPGPSVPAANANRRRTLQPVRRKQSLGSRRTGRASLHVEVTTGLLDATAAAAASRNWPLWFVVEQALPIGLRAMQDGLNPGCRATNEI